MLCDSQMAKHVILLLEQNNVFNPLILQSLIGLM